MCCLLVLTSLTTFASAQNVTTWHNDTYRTGWQQNETVLCSTASNCTQVNQNNTFGLVWQWNPQGIGEVYAQPLAVAGVNTNVSGCQPCDLVFIADEQSAVRV